MRTDARTHTRARAGQHCSHTLRARVPAARVCVCVDTTLMHTSATSALQQRAAAAARARARGMVVAGVRKRSRAHARRSRGTVKYIFIVFVGPTRPRSHTHRWWEPTSFCDSSSEHENIVESRYCALLTVYSKCSSLHMLLMTIYVDLTHTRVAHLGKWNGGIVVK